MKLIWSALLAVGGTTLGCVLMCIAPFAAVATFAARTLPLRYAAGAVAAMWALNQCVGYAFLHYPRTPDSFAWGIVTGAAAFLAMMCARRIASPAFSFATAFATYECALFAFAVATGDRSGFTPPIVAEVLLGNLIGVALFGALTLALRERYLSVR